MSRPIWPPSGGGNFSSVFLTGVCRTCLSVSKMAARLECPVLRLRDVQVQKTYLDAWKAGKLCCPHKDCLSESILLCSDGLKHHFRIRHSRDPPCGDQEIKEGKNILRKRLADETLNNLLILSQKRREQFQASPLPTPAPETQPVHAGIMQGVPDAVSKEDEPLHVMKTVFGYDSFREGQQQAIQAIVEGKDCVILMPTGGGKSLIFTIASIIKQGLTVIIEPLKFLMEEQVAALREKGVSAFYFNSSLTDTEMDFVVHSLTRFRSQYVMLFTSPECIFNVRLQNVLSNWKGNSRLAFIAIDEAHCIDSWGVGFRPDFTRLGELKKFGTAMAAFTGTATPHTLQVVIDSLKLQQCTVIKTSFMRENLFIEVQEKKDNAKKQVATILQEKFQNSCGIVYCARRQDAMDMAQELKKHNISVTYVHGTLSDTDRKKHEELWSNGNAKVMCATKCFGMGINKEDV
ncbi:ATP-dependent DNA helicase Q-like 1 isoform X2 [Orbicella faveolata]|uniref:ATP-dependent DNA helicase Q-like 1 isoform X2 n=1 Tax=Orbicella faveolata TaxID=48498 RepID=UPI0009E48833|nr:ATP-dependent DNA helicase Q-like 1 isoform X2 [Orbicella faveolata]